MIFLKKLTKTVGIEVILVKLSTKGRYGLKAVYELGKCPPKVPVSIKTIAENQHISEHYLEQLMASLRKAGVVVSIRGAGGGYLLTKIPTEITVGEVVTALEGPIALTECSEDKDSVNCNHAGDCVLRPLWERISESLRDTLDSVTIQDLLDNQITF